MRVAGHDWLYCVGDANGIALLTHVGKHQARIALDAVAGKDVHELLMDGALAPRVIFTDPQVAAVGHTTASAAKAGLRVRPVSHATQGTAGGSFVGKGVDGEGLLLLDEDAGVLAGATFTGFEVAEWLHAATIAVRARVPLEILADAIPTFPTRSEIWLRLFEKAGYYRAARSRDATILRQGDPACPTDRSTISRAAPRRPPAPSPTTIRSRTRARSTAPPARSRTPWAAPPTS